MSDWTPPSPSIEPGNEGGTVVFAVFQEYAPDFSIKYKDRHELYELFLKELHKRNIRLSELYWTEDYGGQIEITDADRLFDIVNMNKKVHLTIRSDDDDDDCSSDSSSVSSEPTDKRTSKNQRRCCTRPTSYENHRWNRHPRPGCHSCNDRFYEHLWHNPAHHYSSPHPPVFGQCCCSPDPRFEHCPRVMGCCHGGSRGGRHGDHHLD